MKIFNKIKVFVALAATVFIAKPFFAQKKKALPQKPSIVAGEMSQPSEPEAAGTCDAPYVPTDHEVASVAIKLCFDGKEPKYALKNAMELLRVENQMEVPASLRGMTLAAACRESGFDANAQGDHKYSKDGKTPVAIGILQMWPFYKGAYGVDRKSVTSSATGWLKHIKRQLEPTAKRCNPKSLEDNWRIAWVTGVRAPKQGGRCKEYVSHWFLFKKIQQELELIKKEHEKWEPIASAGVPVKS